MTKLYYDIYKIKKKSGGLRIIHKPSPELAVIQKGILQKLNKLRIQFPKCVKAYVKKRRISDMYAEHEYGVTGFKMDIKNFFHSCTVDMFRKNALELGVPSKIIGECVKYCFTDMTQIYTELEEEFYMGLPQGASTSPIVSNICMYQFDSFIQRILVGPFNGTYTRYADDITITLVPTNHPGNWTAGNDSVYMAVSKRIEEHGFQINFKKCRLWGSDNHARVCGAILVPYTYLEKYDYKDEQPWFGEGKYGRISFPKVKRDYWKARFHKMIKDIEQGVCKPGQWKTKKGKALNIRWDKLTGIVNWMREVNAEQSHNIIKKFERLKEVCKWQKEQATTK